MSTSDDAKWMTEALQEARKGHPSPNPHVGAVVVSAAGELIASGYHDRAGEAHAETVALDKAGERARGGTLYVTLEPCNHLGRTGPCVDAILNAGIARVVIAARDPNPHVQGGGTERLRTANVQVDTVLAEEGERLLRPWAKFITSGLPFVALKLALSVDGRIATRTGASRWITGKTARAKVHALRARHDAVAVGIGTVLADDPTLTVRDAPGENAIRVVFDSKLRLPISSKLVTTIDQAPLVVLTTESAPADGVAALEDRGVTVLRADNTTEGRVDLLSALQALGSINIVSLMVEGGAELAGSFLAARLGDQLHAFVAPSLLGPRGRPGAVDWAGPATPQEAPRLERPTWELCGDDAYLHGEIVYPDERDA